MPVSSRGSFADVTYEKISMYWQMINRHTKTNIIQLTFAEKDDAVFGGYAPKTDKSFLYQIKKLNMKLFEGCSQVKNVYLTDINSLYFSYGAKQVFDEKIYYTAKMPIAVEMLPYLAEKVLSLVQALSGKFKKCVICDLDNTLWGGVIGDDGIDKIEIGELGLGMAFTALQRWLLELKNRGIILAVCSKNEEAAAKEPFLKHPDMILRLEDISVFVANWQDKASNIRQIQAALNIGMDSLVFLDDNPFERNAVKSLIPEITVPELPDDPALYLGFLQEQNLFETASYSEEDSDRTKQYQAEMGRKQLEQQFGSYDEYLESLEMIAEAKPFDSFHFPRIAQLTQRSTQFNLRTVRYSEAEIEAISKDDKYITLYFTLKDKFGDHGLISVVILEKQASSLFIHEWLMSCRVLKRGMEEFIVDKIIKVASENGYGTVTGEYIKTPKNAMVEKIYENMGFSQTDDGKYTVETSAYIPHTTYISE